MTQLSDQDREVLAEKVFSRTGIPLSSDDPIFAVVEIIKSADEALIDRVDTACFRATSSLTQAAEHIEERSIALQSMVDSYIESRIEAANATLNIETKRLKSEIDDHFRSEADRLTKGMIQELGSFTKMQCIHPLSEALERIPQRSWLENVWTLVACLSIGFLTGFVLSQGSLHVRRDQPISRSVTDTPSPTKNSR